MNPIEAHLAEPTLRPGTSLKRLAEILRFAALLGDDAKRKGQSSPGDSERRSTESECSNAPFEAAVLELFRLLDARGIRYLLVGGIALLRYVPGRNTEDIDLLLAFESLEHLPEIAIEERTNWFAKGRFKGLRIDLLLTTNPLFRRVLEQYATVQIFLELGVPCATPEGLILLKLYALPSLYCQGNLQRANLYEGDVAALLLATQPSVEPLFEELSQHVSPTDLGELRKIVAEVRTREKRFEKQ